MNTLQLTDWQELVQMRTRTVAEEKRAFVGSEVEAATSAVLCSMARGASRRRNKNTIDRYMQLLRLRPAVVECLHY